MQSQATQIIRKVRKFGAGSAHVVIPSNWIDKEVQITQVSPNPIIKEISWPAIEELIQERTKHFDLKKIKSMIENEIEAVKRGY